ncbi:hypothetical protein V5P93_000702 [Actinokineospora auranticolor]|uniref:Uncharacterized protein n=1 Tax=Actinokineospora auranticolor TaxID=155976 RepID=A0A2S6GZ25_9PSEU|nr:hypothetical protein [Actinokineospora auranticolor]PPK70417.1 hypothetical protein CLV40_102332 [Actinokineospora auranticolor]
MADTANWPRVTCATILVAATLAACETKAQFAPSLPPAAGFRVDDGVLKLWTGTPCQGVTGITLIFDTGTAKSTEQTWTAPPPGVLLEHMDLLGTKEPTTTPLEVQTPLPTTYDWTKADSLNFAVSGPPANGARLTIPQVLVESPQHPPNTYLFGQRGWMNAADVQRENGKSFLTVCTPDPG